MVSNVPTNGEIVFWCALVLILALGLLFINQYAEPSDSIDDMAAWSRNYERLQRRR